MMRRIATHGITYIEPLDGSCEWYWGSDYVKGDLYEAEELYRDHHPVTCNRLVFVHYPDGRVVEPIKGKEGQYFGQPISYDGKIQILLADFPCHPKISFWRSYRGYSGCMERNAKWQDMGLAIDC